MVGAPLAIGVVGLAAGTQAFGSIMAGREKARQSDFRAQQLDQEAQAQKTRGDLEEAERRETMLSEFQSIEAVRGARGLGNSPSGFAALRKIGEDARQDARIARINALSASDTASRAASESRRSGRSQQLAGYLGAGAALGTGAFRGLSILRI